MAKATVHDVDFTNVKDGGAFNTKRIDAGDYLAKIVKVEDSPVKKGDNKGAPQYLFTIKLVELPSSTFPYYCQLTENQLWKLRNLLIAAGKAVPKRRTKVDPNTVVGKLIGVLIDDDEYECKERSTINGVFPASDLPGAVSADGDDEDEDEEDAPLEEEEVPDTSDDDDEADEDEADEDDEDEADPLSDLTRAQLKAEIIKLQSDFQARKSQSDDDLRDVLRGLQSAADDEEEEDEEPTPPPAKKKAAAAKKAPAKRKAKPKAEDIEDEELDELDIDNL